MPPTHFCAFCGDHARHPKSPQVDLRRKACPRHPDDIIHRGCCATETCSRTDERGHVRCMWADAEVRRRVRTHLASKNQTNTPTPPTNPKATPPPPNNNDTTAPA